MRLSATTLSAGDHIKMHLMQPSGWDLEGIWVVLFGAVLALALPVLLLAAFLPKDKRSAILHKLKRKLIM